jgi:hypothetical protein
MSKRLLIGALVGGVVDIAAANLLSVPIAAYLAALHANHLAYALSLGIWGLSSILGGYVAARIAKGKGIVVGALSSYACVVAPR